MTAASNTLGNWLGKCHEPGEPAVFFNEIAGRILLLTTAHRDDVTRSCKEEGFEIRQEGRRVGGSPSLRHAGLNHVFLVGKLLYFVV